MGKSRTPAAQRMGDDGASMAEPPETDSAEMMQSPSARGTPASAVLGAVQGADAPALGNKLAATTAAADGVVRLLWRPDGEHEATGGGDASEGGHDSHRAASVRRRLTFPSEAQGDTAMRSVVPAVINNARAPTAEVGTRVHIFPAAGVCEGSALGGDSEAPRSAVSPPGVS